MSLPATENFTGAAGAISGSWTQESTTTVDRDGVGAYTCANASDDALAWWNADSFNNDQYSQVQITAGTPASGNTIGAAVRASGAGATRNHYVLQTSDGLWKCINNNWTNIFGEKGTDGETWAIGDIVRLEITGTGWVAKHNGVQYNSGTDASLASGAAGCHTFGGGNIRGDNWEGGNIGGGGGGSKPALYYLRMAAQ
jgi:hypothetical protein